MAVKVQYKYECNVLVPDSTEPLVGLITTLPVTTGLEVAGATNDEPGADANTYIPIRISGTRKFGVTARHLVLYRLVGTGSAARRLYTKVPVLTEAAWELMLSQLAPSITFAGSGDWILVGGIGERYHLTYGVPA